MPSNSSLKWMPRTSTLFSVWSYALDAERFTISIMKSDDFLTLSLKILITMLSWSSHSTNIELLLYQVNDVNISQRGASIYLSEQRLGIWLPGWSLIRIFEELLFTNCIRITDKILIEISYLHYRSEKSGQSRMSEKSWSKSNANNKGFPFVCSIKFLSSRYPWTLW